MQVYGYVKDGVLVSLYPEPLPVSFKKDDGVEILAFNRVTNPQDYGWYPWTQETRPTFDLNTQNIKENVIINSSAKTIVSSFSVTDKTSVEIQTALDTLKTSLKNRVDILTNTKIESGFPYNFGGSIGTKTLQTRMTPPNDDRPNWLALSNTAQSFIIAGQGDISLGKIRTKDNSNVPVTAQQAQNAMLGMRVYLGTILEYSWTLKDNISSASTFEQLNAININSGWPYGL